MVTVAHFYFTVANFSINDVQLPGQQNVGEVADACKETVHIRDERFLCPVRAKTTESESCLNAAHYKITPNCLKQISEHNPNQKWDKTTLRKDREEEV